MTDHRESETRCPYCNRRNDRHANPEDANPGDGDLTLCWGCRQVGVFVVGPLGISVRKATDEETPVFMADARVRAALGAAAESFDPVTAAKLWKGL